MSLVNQKRRMPKSKVLGKYSNKETDFSKIGGLSHHIKTLRELIIFPLLHAQVYTHFNVKPARGVLFYGPPGTGKTLVARALANEINSENIGKVNFFHRKGADCLDKWVGESEKKLRNLFEKARRTSPSIIFFDEIDGLAPARSTKNDHVHCSVVSTLLALMDGLDGVNGVVVIGATNRLDALDPALRRPGRFDKELYFPMPCTDARSEILQVHTQSWKHKPSQQLLDRLAGITAGFCGSDLQALCAEAVMCCTKRMYPSLDKSDLDCNIKIDLDKIKVEECDFHSARINAVPSSQKNCTRLRQLCPIIEPLLKRQIDNILTHIEMMWPHFLQKEFKFLLGCNRYAGRMILVGTNKQGLNTHIIPALLHKLEHLPSYVLDVPALFELPYEFSKIRNHLPSLLILSRIDEWWECVEEYAQISVAAVLEDIHAGLPILTIATCKKALPMKVQDFFCHNCSVTINIEDPTEEERSQFFAPLFFNGTQLSLYRVLIDCRSNQALRAKIRSTARNPRRMTKMPNNHRLRGGGLNNQRLKAEGIRKSKRCLKTYTESDISISRVIREIKKEKPDGVTSKTISRARLRKARDSGIGVITADNYISSIESNLVNNCVQSSVCNSIIKIEPPDEMFEISGKQEDSFANGPDEEKQNIFNLWRRLATVTTANMTLTHLEILYDAVALCINMNKYNFSNMIESLQETLDRIESVQPNLSG